MQNFKKFSSWFQYKFFCSGGKTLAYFETKFGKICNDSIWATIYAINKQWLECDAWPRLVGDKLKCSISLQTLFQSKLISYYLYGFLESCTTFSKMFCLGVLGILVPYVWGICCLYEVPDQNLLAGQQRSRSFSRPELWRWVLLLIAIREPRYCLISVGIIFVDI